MTPATLYSFRRCPYAMRARMALHYSGVAVEIEEVSLKNKPARMLALSSKGTVPVLACADGRVIEQSLEIMHWALAQHDPQDWLLSRDPLAAQATALLIEENDTVFKQWLDRYKYAVRYPEFALEHYRQQGGQFLLKLDGLLARNGHLLAEHLSLADIAVAPFVRQFAHVDQVWFAQAPYKHLQAWLEQFLASELFNAVMAKR
ncbi:glutathione S-transferase [Pseudomonas sp. MWU13-2105]|uniref:glutathione S-transferase n=1 Tax=Pseudomonas sp. MWU13-2105 TaxID=2935074 RepID=UPI00201042F0|nr:glutathione S-transferase [Pseudomonas sp. MWU13-2105]